MADATEKDSAPFVPGFFLDAKGRVVLAAISDGIVAVSLTRFEAVPTIEDIQSLTNRAFWILFRRDNGYEMTFSDDPTKDHLQLLKQAEGRETLELGLGMGMALWPDWCPDLRNQVPHRHMNLLLKTLEA